MCKKYREGRCPETPEGISDERFHETIREWYRIEEAAGRKVKGTIHWVNANACSKVMVRLYENIVDEEKGKLNEDGTLNLNPNSLTVIENCYVEPALAEAKAYDSFQFVRNGFFCADCKDSKPGNPVFNRIVSLKSSFKIG